MRRALLARLRHAAMSAVRSLTWVDWTWRGQPDLVEIDPTATLTGQV